MSKKLYILAVMSAFVISACGKEHYINEGCTVNDNYCDAGILYQCVAASDNETELNEFGFVDPENAEYSSEQTSIGATFWKEEVNCITNSCGGDGACKPIKDCANGANPDGSCRCPSECTNGCTDAGACKQSKDCKNGYNNDGTCRCPDECENGCTDIGACKQRTDCVNGYKDDGTCKCPDKCKNGCDEKGEICLCPTACPQSCDDTGAECTCEANCVVGCDVNTGNCKCTDKCTAGCDERGTCDAECEGVICQGVNDECRKGECVDLCKDIICEKSNEYCNMGKCVFWDVNGNHLHDMYETAVKQGQNCRQYKDCDSSDGAGDGFCDSFLGYKCSTKCTDDSQCVDDGEYHYICRPDGRCAPDTFVTVWKIPPKEKEDIDDSKLHLRIPTSTATACDFTIDWGDGTKSEGCVKNSKDDTIHCKELGKNTLICDVTCTSAECKSKCDEYDNGSLDDDEHNYDKGDLHHTYQDPGFVTVKIKGKYDGFGWPAVDQYYFAYPHNKDNSSTKLSEVKAFGPVGLGPFAFAFANAKLTLSALSEVDIPDATKMQDMRYTFYISPFSTVTFNLPIENWDMSHVVDMRGMFKYAKQFNQPLDHWDTSSVKWMGNKVDNVGTGIEKQEGVFSNAGSFNQPLEHWDTSNVVSLSYMFYGATAFNHSVNDWDTSKVMHMYGTFYYAEAFDQSLDKWDTSNVIDMRYTFAHAHAFNQPLDAWNTSNVVDMSNMFNGAVKFNGAISNWNTQHVTNMSDMFNGAESFNQPINYSGSGSVWLTSNVTDMHSMFEGAKSFNQSLDKWTPGYVKNMERMFYDATSFNQDLSSWQFATKVTVTDMFQNTKLAKDSPNIYCKIFNAWEGKVQATTCSDLGMAECSCE